MPTRKQANHTDEIQNQFNNYERRLQEQALVQRQQHQQALDEQRRQQQAFDELKQQQQDILTALARLAPPNNPQPAPIIAQPPPHAPPIVALQPPAQPIANHITIVQSPQLPVLPLYDGSTDVNDFLEHFDVLAAASQWTPQAQAHYLYMYLADNPRTTIQQLPNNNDINAIKQRLVADYAPSPEKYMQLYEERVPKKNEKPKAFALAIQKLLSRRMPTLSQDNKEKLLKNKFMKYLPKPTQIIMKLAAERDWATLVKDVDTTIETFGLRNQLHATPKDHFANHQILQLL
jgi:hypothetical protein